VTSHIRIRNLAAGGNRVLANNLRPNALGRINRGVIAHPGVQYAMIGLKVIWYMFSLNPCPTSHSGISDQGTGYSPNNPQIGRLEGAYAQGKGSRLQV
jgi:hypothetical protein